jgi:hypothetical protein
MKNDQKGAEAYAEGRLIGEDPHRPGSPASRAWRKGWLRALGADQRRQQEQKARRDQPRSDPFTGLRPGRMTEIIR